MLEDSKQNPNKITIHCSDTTNGLSASIAAMREEHIKRGFSDIGYHYMIQPSGEVVNGRPLNVVGAHVQGENKNNIGICLIGKNKFTKAQFSSLYRLVDTLRICYQIKPYNTYCHYQFPSAVKQKKECPNIVINHLLAWVLLENLEAISPYLIKEGGDDAHEKN